VFLRTDVELLHLVEKRRALHPAQASRRLGLIAPVGAERGQDLLPLGSALRAERLGARGRASRAPGGTKRDQLGPDQVSVGRERHGALDRALQLLDVSGPGMAPELRPGVSREGYPLPG